MYRVRLGSVLIACMLAIYAAWGQCVVLSTTRALNEHSSIDGPTDDDDRRTIATDGNGNVVVVWRSKYNFGGTIGLDGDLLVRTSSDYGASWSSTRVLNSYALADTINDDLPKLATDRDGVWMCVWQKSDPRDGTTVDSDLVYSRSLDNGVNWSFARDLNANAVTETRFNSEPVIATDGGSDWIVAWHSNQPMVGEIEIGPDDDILYATSGDDGLSWSETRFLNTDADVDSAVDRRTSIAWVEESTFIVAWDSVERSGPDADIYFSRTTDAGANWSAPAALHADASGGGHDYGVQLTVESPSAVGAIWYSNRNRLSTLSDFDIFLVRSTNGGVSWSSPIIVNSNATSDSDVDTFPSIGSSPEGKWVAVWRSETNLGGTIGADRDLFISCSEDSGQTWSAVEVLNDTAGIDGGAFDSGSEVIYDGDGGWIVVWVSQWDPVGMEEGDIEVLIRTHKALLTDLDVLVVE